jgi:hypothetical protein
MVAAPRLLLKEDGMRRAFRLLGIVMLLLPGSASASKDYPNKSLFLSEEDTTTHGRKNWFHRIVESDPGLTDYIVAADYQEHPPRRIAATPAKREPSLNIGHSLASPASSRENIFGNIERRER